MKKLFGLLLITYISGMFITSCKEDDKPFYSAVMSANFVTDLKGMTSFDPQLMMDTFNTAALLNPASNPDYWYYRYGVDKVKVTSVTMKITSNNDDLDVVNGKLSFFELGNDTIVVSKGENIPDTQWTISDTPFKLGQTVVFKNSNHQYENIADMLYNLKPFGVAFEGTTEDSNIQFECQLLITTEVWIYY